MEIFLRVEQLTPVKTKYNSIQIMTIIVTGRGKVGSLIITGVGVRLLALEFRQPWESY